MWIFDWDNIERAHVANQKPELRSPERIVFGQRKKKLQQQQQNGVVLDLALKEIPVPVQIHFVCEEIFGRMSQLKASSCLFTESQDAADILSKSFLTLDLPHPQNLRTVIDKQAYKHGVNFLFFVTH